MEKILKELCDYTTLSREEACDLLLQITSGYCNEAQIAGFVSVFLMRRLTVEELMGFQDAMLSNCNHIYFPDYDLLDIVGTGGDGKNTFNISTTTAFVVAGAGIKVAKHGNHAASSISGSSDVLQYLGYRFTNDTTILNRQLTLAGICFLHAPLFHPVMKHVASTRKHLRLRTFFNLLGPILNPADPSTQFLGVSHLSGMRLYQYLLQERQVKQYGLVSSLDGYDEISLTGAFKLITPVGEQILLPRDINMALVCPKDLDGGSSVKEAAEIMINILKGNGTDAQNHVVLANSGFAIHCSRPEMSLSDSLELAKESLSSGKAYRAFFTLINNQS